MVHMNIQGNASSLWYLACLFLCWCTYLGIRFAMLHVSYSLSPLIPTWLNSQAMVLLSSFYGSYLSTGIWDQHEWTYIQRFPFQILSCYHSFSNLHRFIWLSTRCSYLQHDILQAIYSCKLSSAWHSYLAISKIFC